MKQTKLKPWVRWLYLASSVIWLVNLVVRLSNYFRRLGRGVPLEQLARALGLHHRRADRGALAGRFFRLADGPEKVRRLAGQADPHGGDHSGLGGHPSPGRGRRLSAVLLVDHPGGIGRRHPLRRLEIY